MTVRSANFSRHHYLWLAQALREVVKGVSDQTGEHIASKFAHMLAQDNPNFNRQLFLDNIYK